MIGSVLSLLSVSLVGQFFNLQANWEDDRPVQYRPEISHVYKPIGFDSNDTAQIIVEVEFQHGCQEFGKVAVFPHEENPNVLLLAVQAFDRSNEDGLMCIQQMKKKIKPVDIGKLSPGEYEIKTYDDLDESWGSLKVREPKTSKIDDENYAPVDSIVIHEDSQGIRRLITLVGTFENTCFRMWDDPEDNRVRIAKTADGLIEVLPVVKVENRFDCEKARVPFYETYVIPERQGRHEIETGRYLFHVRVDHGQAFNKVDYIEMDPNRPYIPDN